ncbi:MAG: NUDIX hydrolase [Candidatus Promineifilaceae bacterium]
MKLWDSVERKELGDYTIFRLTQQRSRSPRNGREHSFYVLETADWVNVIPITPEGKVVLIRQYRVGIDTVTLEIPGGMVDAADESPAESARRELLEETGYAADEIVQIGRVSSNPAFINNYTHTFLARNARLVGETHFDSAEYIEFELADIEDIPTLIATGQITHSLVIAAFYHYENYQRGNKWVIGGKEQR